MKLEIRLLHSPRPARQSVNTSCLVVSTWPARLTWQEVLSPKNIKIFGYKLKKWDPDRNSKRAVDRILYSHVPWEIGNPSHGPRNLPSGDCCLQFMLFLSGLSLSTTKVNSCQQLCILYDRQNVPSAFISDCTCLQYTS